jgi:hypothetical protein
MTGENNSISDKGSNEPLYMGSTPIPGFSA